MGSDGNDERKFLHDLASPLGTATLLFDMVLTNFQKKPDLTKSENDQLLMLGKALENMRDRLKERRDILVSSK